METPTFQDAIGMAERRATDWREEQHRLVRDGNIWKAEEARDKAAAVEQLARDMHARLGQ